MFKLIGFIVFVAVAFFGFSSFQKWYAGEATPKETVSEVRNKLGEALITEKTKTAVSAPATDPQPVRNDSSAVRPAADESKEIMPTDANQLLKQMMDQKK